MTEYRYPGSTREAEFVAELERFRGSGTREIMTRALVVGGYAPDATMIDGPDALADLPTDRVLALAPTPFLDDDLQRALADWVRRGGRLLLSGPVPQHDMEGHPATALIDALGRIGGHEAMAVSLEELRRTTQPLEVALLARNLEEGAPGTHGEQVMAAIHDALQSAERAPIDESPDVGPLFDLLRAYGGMAAQTILEQSLPAWTEYALIALAEGMRLGDADPDPADPPAQPILFATGSEDAILEQSRALAEVTPGGSFVELPGRHHFNAPGSRDFRRAALDFFAQGG